MILPLVHRRALERYRSALGRSMRQTELITTIELISSSLSEDRRTARRSLAKGAPARNDSHAFHDDFFMVNIYYISFRANDVVECKKNNEEIAELRVSSASLTLVQSRGLTTLSSSQPNRQECCFIADTLYIFSSIVISTLSRVVRFLEALGTRTDRVKQ